jgi:hypothetical protein
VTEQQGPWWTRPPEPPVDADRPVTPGPVAAPPDDPPGTYPGTSYLERPDGDPLAHLRPAPDPTTPSDPAILRLLNGPRGLPVMLAALAALGVIGLVALAVLFGGDDAPSSTPTGSSASGGTKPQSGKAAGTGGAGTTPKGLAKVPAADARAQVARVDQRAGKVSAAWGWTDENGKNLLVTSTSGARNRTTLTVFHVARLDSRPTLLRRMTDPNLPGCRTIDSGAAAGFTAQALSIRDLDDDGIAEVLVGWSSRCGAKGTESQVRLALISNGKKYIIRGAGVVGTDDSGSRRPDPAAGNWPKAYLSAATKLFRDVYY